MKETTLKVYKERILRSLVFIQQHLDEEIELGTLARVAYFSPYHFHRIFHGMTGESVKEHVRRTGGFLCLCENEKYQEDA